MIRLALFHLAQRFGEAEYAITSEHGDVEAGLVGTELFVPPSPR